MDLLNDETGLPSEGFLKAIREWPKGQYAAMMSEIRRAWRFGGFSVKGEICRVETRGWEGNEAIIEALQDNAEFWANCWHSTTRGGRWEFEVPKGW